MMSMIWTMITSRRKSRIRTPPLPIPRHLCQRKRSTQVPSRIERLVFSIHKRRGQWKPADEPVGAAAEGSSSVAAAEDAGGVAPSDGVGIGQHLHAQGVGLGVQLERLALVDRIAIGRAIIARVCRKGPIPFRLTEKTAITPRAVAESAAS